MAKKVTIENVAESVDDLAKIVKKGFDGVDKRFDKIEKRLVGVDGRFDRLEKSVDEIKMKMAYVAWQIDMKEVMERLAKVEKKVGIKK
jgi:tetrahydromethanopterin S-methyltransferase subunit G